MRPADPLDAGRGDLLQFEYPERNLLNVRPVWKPRIVVVHSVIDTLKHPVPAEWFRRRPMINRTRYLVVGYDPQRGAMRQFYREAMRGLEHAHWLQLALYDPLNEQAPLLRHPRRFAPTVEDRLFLLQLISRFHRTTAARVDRWMSVGIFPWEPANGRHSSACPPQA
jgi:hypothetical protein